ncbi:MAG: helix-turn-helix transcriptional regulator [Geminicoccaceae bacterium]
MRGFGAKLHLVMKLQNISRGRLAAEAEVDKSVVSRWLAGVARPSDHNLTRLTELVGRRWPSFSRLAWELDQEEFARTLGAPALASAEPAAPPAAALPFALLAVARRAVPREGLVYPGLYLGYRQAFANTGITIAVGLRVSQAADRLLAEIADGPFDYRGELLLLGGQLFAILEEVTRLDEILLLVLNGVSAPMARIMDGVMLGVAADRAGTPTATTIVFERFADLESDAALDARCWRELRQEVGRVNREQTARARMPEAFAAIVDAVVGGPRADGQTDHLLRVPYHRSLVATTAEESWHPRTG